MAISESISQHKLATQYASSLSRDTIAHGLQPAARRQSRRVLSFGAPSAAHLLDSRCTAGRLEEGEMRRPEEELLPATIRIDSVDVSSEIRIRAASALAHVQELCQLPRSILDGYDGRHASPTFPLYTRPTKFFRDPAPDLAAI